jgi:hypothetical protein
VLFRSEDAKKPLNRTEKLSGDSKAADIAKSEILDVHNAPTDLQEG